MSEYYKELLQRPEWNEKRIHILIRDGFKCAECGKSNVELQVHHKKYIKGRMPWEYSDRHLVTLCDPCHDTVHVVEKSKGIVIKKSKEDMVIKTINPRQPTKRLTKTGEFLVKNSGALGGFKSKMRKPKKYKKQKFKTLVWGVD